MKTILAVIGALGLYGYVDSASPDIDIQPAALSDSSRDPLFMPFYARNVGRATFRVETARCAAWEFNPGAGSGPTPGTENCTIISGNPVLKPGESANLWPCFSGVPPTADQIDVVFMLRAKTVGWRYWPEIEKRDRWRVVRDGRGGYGVSKPTPMPTPNDNACNDQVIRERSGSTP